MTPTTPDVTLFPRARWAAALAAAVRDVPADVLDYGGPEGTEALRERLADELGRTRGVVTDPSQIVIVQGTAQGLDIVLRMLRQSDARQVAVEDPSLDRQQQQINGLGLKLVGQPVDGEGLIVSGLDADAVIVSPAHQFPTGAVLSGARRRELLAWSQETGGLIIEDDYDAEFRYDREPVRALQGLQPDSVIYLGSTSKTLAPALRLGWLVAPRRLVEQLVAIKLLLDDFSPTLEQLALAHMLEAGHYQRHIRKTRSVYRARRNQLILTLAEHFPQLSVSGVAAGLSVTLNLPTTCNDVEFEQAALDAGVSVQALSRYGLGRVGQPGLVIGYGRMHEAAIEPAIATLGRVLTPLLLPADDDT
jgi:GntR family transcriptional regulator/MocR family aminotransferase